MQPRAIGVEDARDAYVHIVLSMVVHHQSFGDTLAFIITTANPDRIDVSPVAFGLRMNLRVAINFGRGGLKNACVDALGQSQHVDRAHDRGLDRLNSIVLIMNRRGRTSEIINLVNFKQDRLNDIVAQQLEARVAEKMKDVFASPREEIVQADDLVPVQQQALAKMRADKTCAACDEYPHALRS